MTSRGRGVTQSDVADAVGVSRSLVSLTMSGSPKVAAETREHVLEVARSLGYRVNASASALARRRSSTIGLVLPNLRNAFFEKMARCLDDAAAEEGLTVFLAVGAENKARLSRAIDSLLGVRVLGIVLVSPWLTGEELRSLAAESPTVLIGQRSPGGLVDAVHLDEEEAARRVVAHLRERGAGSVAYIAPRVVDDASRHLREQALAAAAAAAGLPFRTWEGDGNGAGGAIRELLTVADAGASDASNGTQPAGRLGLVAHNDMLAIDAVAVLRDRRSSSEAPLLVSYDDTYLARRSEFALTSLAQPEEDLARLAVRLLIDRASAEGEAPEAQDLIVEPELVVRRSTSAD